MRGRKPKPTALKLVAGNPGRRKLDRREIAPKSLIGRPPGDLDDVARAEWFAVVGEINATGALKSVDTTCLKLYCQAVSAARQAWTIVEREGLTAENEKGGVFKHPAWNIWREAALVVEKFASDFGLTPAARVRVKVPEQAPEDPFAVFMKGRA